MMDVLLTLPDSDVHRCVNIDHNGFEAIRVQETFTLGQVHGSRR